MDNMKTLEERILGLEEEQAKVTTAFINRIETLEKRILHLEEQHAKVTIDAFTRIETLESRLEVVKEVLMESKAKSFKFYSEQESKTLIEALTGVPLGPEVMKTCTRLIQLGWNDRFDQQRTASALRSKYLRLIGEK